jgi:DNA uptake protein ComE-like DNA-binding protein
MGHGAGNYTIPLSVIGSDDVTHLACHTWAAESFVQLIQAAKAGHQPDGMPDVSALMPHLVMHAENMSGGDYVSATVTFERMLAENNLRRPGPINVNTDNAAALQTLSGVGPSLASAIIEGRTYESVADVSRVSGISAATVAGWGDGVTV